MAVGLVEGYLFYVVYIIRISVIIMTCLAVAIISFFPNCHMLFFLCLFMVFNLAGKRSLCIELGRQEMPIFSTAVLCRFCMVVHYAEF